MSSISRYCTVDDTSREDLTVFAGNHLQIDYTCRDSASTAYDITSATITFTCYDLEGGANEFQISTAQATEIEITSASDGEFSVYLTPDETDTDAKVYKYDIFLEDQNSKQFTVAAGFFIVRNALYTGT